MAHSDIPFTLKAFGEITIQKVGAFVYAKAATRPIDIIIDSQRTQMEAGDKSRVLMPFDSFVISNPNDQPVTGTLVVGDGDYWRQIVQGSITVAPGIKTADGSFKADTRYTLALEASLKPGFSPVEYTSGEQLSSGEIQGFARAGQPYQLSLTPAGMPVAMGWDNNPYIGFLDTDVMSASAFGAYVPNDAFYDFCYLSPDQVYLLSANFNGSFYAVRQMDFVAGVQVAQSDRLDEASSNYFGAIFAMNGALIVMPAAGRAVYSMPYDLSSREQVADITDQLPAWAQPERIGSGLFFAGQIWLFMENGVVILDQHFKLVNSYQYVGYVVSVTGIPARDGRSVISADNTGGYRVFSLHDVTLSAQGHAALSGCGGGSLKVPTLFQADAKITTTRQGPKTLVMGECIKAVLELYFNRMMPDDYLDHVFGFAYTDQYGIRQNVQSNGDTFAALQIADSFVVTTPGEFDITIDKGL